MIANPTPSYPEVARRIHLEGVVKVQVVIGLDGRVKETSVIGGYPLLVLRGRDAEELEVCTGQQRDHGAARVPLPPVERMAGEKNNTRKISWSEILN